MAVWVATRPIYPRISFSPSTTRASSSSDARARRDPIRSTDSGRIWLILIQDRFGRPTALLSSVRGKPARGAWLLIATAMTVPDRSLNTSWLSTRTGRRPDCSWPRTGLSSAQRISPLSIRAMIPGLGRDPRRPGASLRADSAWRTLERDGSGQAGGAYQPERFRQLGSGCETGDLLRGHRLVRPGRRQESGQLWSSA